MKPHDAGLPEPSGQLPAPHRREPAPVAGRIDPAPPPPPAPPAIAPPALAAAPDVTSLLAALRRRWISAVLLGGSLAALAAVGMWHLLAPKHTAFASIRVRAFEPSPLGARPGGVVNDFKTVLHTTQGQIKSRNVIMAALKRDEVKRLQLEGREPDPIGMIEEELKVEFKDNSELVTILFSHADPKVAQVIANAIKEAFFTDVVDHEKTARAADVAEVGKLFENKVASLNTKKGNLKKLVETLKTTDPNLWREQRNEMATSLRAHKEELGRVRFRKIEVESQLETATARLRVLKGRAAGTGDTTDPRAPKLTQFIDDALEADSETRDLRARVRRVETLVEAYVRDGFRPDYYRFEDARERLAAARKQLERRQGEVVAKAKRDFGRQPAAGPAGADPTLVMDELRLAQEHLQRQSEALASLEDSLRGEIKRLQTEVNKAPSLATEYETLADEIKREEGLIAEMGREVERKKIDLEAASRITRYQDAEMMKKDNKKQLLATLVAPIAVLLTVSVGLAYLEFRQRRVRNAGEISRGLGIRVVGAVPRMPHLERQLVAAESELEGTPVMESIDAIRTRLLHEADARSTRLVLVTSATSGEGKTTLAAALATSLARAGRKTLLLDGDLRRPTVHELFEVPMQPGFSEVLLGEIEVAEAAQETAQENLSVLPAGQWDREVLLALSRDGLEGVFDKLGEEFDFIVIDSHPVLAATDSLLIGRQVDAVILSVLREVSQMPRVYAAEQQLAALGIRVLGAVVNGTNPEEVFTAPPAPSAAVA